MIGYRASCCREDEIKMDIHSPSQILAYEVVNLGQIWILEELLCKLNSCLDAKTKYQTKLFLNGVADGTIPVYDKNIDTTRYLLLFDKIVDALSKHLGFEIKCLAWLTDLDTAFDFADEYAAFQSGVEIACEGNSILYAYNSIPSPLEGIEYQLYYLNKAGDTIVKDKFDSFEKLAKITSECINSYEHYGTENVYALVISNGETLFEVWNNSENSGFEVWDTPDNW